MYAARVTASAALVAAVALTISSPVAAQDQVNCLMCHADVSLFAGRDDALRLVVSQDEYSQSVHGALGLTCVMCHQGWSFPHTDQMQPATCGGCHGAVQSQFVNSLHGYAFERGNPRAPTCADCHGSHGIRRSSDPESNTHRRHVATMCANCHGAAGLLTDDIVKLPRPFAAYAASIHGRSAEAGEVAAAICTDCHGVHDLGSPEDPTSKINHVNVSATCGQCHTEIQLEFERSIHGRALRAGIHDSPTCNDCHGEHLILAHDDPEATTYAARLATETCGTCHNDPVIIQEYGLRGGVVGTYVDSYHGWASRRRYERSATCVSCHTTHLVLPETDSTSTIHPANLVATCQQCHPEADREFATSYTHRSASIEANPVNRFVRTAYIVLIAVTIGGMLLHNLVVMNYYVMERRRQQRDAASLLRLDRTQVVQHLALTISFVLLVVTGFALRFPDAWWVVQLGHLGLNEPVRSTLHRICGVVMLLVGLHHVYYVVFVKRGREELKAIVPTLQDVKDVFAALKFYTWRTDRHVRYGRYDYTQKAEYWALVWGTVIMAITGFVLWFPERAVRLFPSWIVAVSQTIHYYEAWLATLAILVWHFFFVIFHPDAYPMSWTWLTGKMSKEDARKHHGRWYEEQIERERTSPDDRANATEPGSETEVAESIS